jgi:YgiT-type zinc finger domain-containing protein
MKCVVGKRGETQPGTTTVTFERGKRTLVMREVPAEVCENCGKDHVNETVDHEELADKMAQSDVQVDVREYVPGSMTC